MGRSPKPARAPKPRVSPEDEALFLGAIDGAVPLAGRDRVKLVPPKVLVTPPAVLPPRQAITLEGTADEVGGRGPGVNRTQLAELRRGIVARWIVGADPACELVVDHLTGPASGLVAAFCPARAADGGAGASYVMVRA